MTKADLEQPTAPHTNERARERMAVVRRAAHAAFGLRGRLLLLVLLTLLPAFGIILYTAHSERQDALVDAVRHARNLSLRAAAAQARRVAETRAILSMLAQIPAINGAEEDCPAFLRAYLRGQTHLANIGVLDTTGRVICSAASAKGRTLNASDRPYFRHVLARQKFTLGGYEVGRITGQPVLVAAYPMLDTQGKFRSILFAALRLNWLSGVAARANLPKGSVFTLLDRRGKVLARFPDEPDALGRRPPRLAALLHTAPTTGSWSRQVLLAGHDRLVTYTTLGNRASTQNLKVVVSIPAAQALAAVNQRLYRDLTVLSVLGLASLLLAWFSGSLLVLRPVQRLVLAAGSIAAGNLSARTGITNGPYEFRSLSRAFDDMAAALERRRRQGEAQEQRIARLHRIQRVLSAINGAIIRIRNRDELLQEACRIAVDLGHFRFAWVGLLEADGNIVRPVAHAGTARGFTENVRVTVDPNEPSGRGLVGPSIREDTHAVSNAAQDDPRLEAHWEAFRTLGIQSVASFPLRIEHRALGALVLHSSEPGFFDDRELALLDELAADTSLGLEHIDKARQLDFLAYWDPLTNLPNQRLFEDRLEQSLRRAERTGTQVVVLTIDIVEFDFINDTKGWAVGDRLLQAVALRLAATVRGNESLGQLGRHAARLSSQEFGLVLDDIHDLDTMTAVAERITATLAEPIRLDAGEIAITVRLAAAVYPHDGNDARDLLHKAQFALHNQPQTERGHLVFYSPEQDTAAQQRFVMESALRCAVDRDEFYLEYQPRVDARTGQLVGAEALLRWQWPGRGPVPPDQFIPVLERTGLIERVGAWVARTAFAQRLAWRDVVPRSFVLSFNASSCELRDAGYIGRIRNLVEQTGMPAGWMEIEITETGLVESGLTALEKFSSLKALGVRLSVDDFGTGYSSLSYLHQLPVDTLKIDKSFVRDMEHEDGARSIVRSIMGLAGALGLAVVAEGVETERQLQLITREGCHEIQGYYFSRPLAAEVLEALAGTKPAFPLP